jgi:SAM-dependent methyltransferase
VAFFVAAAEAAGGPVLEYGAGAGRVTLPLARAGAEVLAVDRSGAMRRRLKERLAAAPPKVAERVTVRAGDMRSFQSGRRFSLVLATFNVVAHLPERTDVARWLSRVREQLAPGGQLLFDVPLPEAEELDADPDERHPLPRFKHPRTGVWIRHSERYEYDPARQLLLVESELWPEGARDPLVVPLVLRQWFPQEIAALLRYEGFEVELLADYREQPAALAEETLVVRARPEGR